MAEWSDVRKNAISKLDILGWRVDLVKETGEPYRDIEIVNKNDPELKVKAHFRKGSASSKWSYALEWPDRELAVGELNRFAHALVVATVWIYREDDEHGRQA